MRISNRTTHPHRAEKENHMHPHAIEAHASHTLHDLRAAGARARALPLAGPIRRLAARALRTWATQLDDRRGAAYSAHAGA